MLARITYSQNEIVERKVNFFCDYFNLCAKHIGKYMIWDYENPLSLIDKIIFQLENNKENSSNYLAQHLSNYHLDKNGYTSQFKNFEEFHRLSIRYTSASRKIRWLNRNPEFLKTLKKFRKELDRKMVKQALNFVINYLRCSHELDFHREDFIYLTKIIVSDLKFSDRSTRDLNNLIRKIMSKNVKVFPLPISISKIRSKRKFNKAAKDFMNSRTFRQQFEGILNFKEEEGVQGFYLIKVKRLNLEVTDELIFEDIRIVNPQNKVFAKFQKIKKKYIVDDWNKFIEDVPNSIAIVPGDFSNIDNGNNNSINRVQHFVNFLNNKLDLNSYIDIYGIRHTMNFKNVGFTNKYDNSLSPLSERDLEKLERDNPYILLKAKSSDSKRKFIHAEPIYQRALITNNPSDYWHYLECLIPKITLDNGKSKKQVKDICARILAIIRVRKYKTHIANCLFNLLSGHNREKTDYALSYKEMNQIVRNWRNSDIVRKSNYYRQHPIVDCLQNFYKEASTQELLVEHYNFYFDILSELYEVRNSYIHSGATNNFSVTKLQEVIPTLVKTIRTYLLGQISKSRSPSMDLIIKNIRRKTNEKLPLTIDDDGITPSS